MGGQRPASPNRPPWSSAVVIPMRATLGSMVRITAAPEADIQRATMAARRSTAKVRPRGKSICWCRGMKRCRGTSADSARKFLQARVIRYCMLGVIFID